MCIIAYKPAGQSIDRKTLEICYKNNSDGAGFMYPCEGKVLINKGHFSFDSFWKAWEKTEKIHGDKLPVVFHFRISTAGKVDKVNCHPHRITQDLAFVHNGILQCVDVPKKSHVSDTILYRDIFLQGMRSKSLRDELLFRIMGDQIGSWNKFVFMNGQGEVAFANEDSGLWDGGIWYSNSTYKPAVAKPSSGFPFQRKGKYQCCEYCGKDLDTPEEREEGICYSCLDYYDWEYEECGGCECKLTDEPHRLAGYCDDCGRSIYGVEWDTKLEQYQYEADGPEDILDKL